MSAIDKQKLQKLLAQELPQVAIAQALGCSESYVSQCMADPQFAAEVSALRVARIEGAGDRDAKLDALESTLIDKLEKAVSLMLRPGEIINAFKIVNAAKRANSLPAGAISGNLGQQVTLVVPQMIVNNFVQNQNGEIIEAGGRSLTTLPSHVLKQMAASKQQLLSEVSNGRQQSIAAEVRQPPQFATIEAAAIREIAAKAA